MLRVKHPKHCDVVLNNKRKQVHADNNEIDNKTVVVISGNEPVVIYTRMLETTVESMLLI